MLPTFHVVDPRIDHHSLPDAACRPRRNRPVALCLDPAPLAGSGPSVTPTGRPVARGGGLGQFFARLFRRKPGDSAGTLAPVRL